MPPFSYRVNPAGSIFAGASGAGSSAASDAELVLLTFKPIPHLDHAPSP